jgi:prolyl 4-hydroxylase
MMKYESLPAYLRDWLEISVNLGRSREVMVQWLGAIGYEPNFARQAIELALARLMPDKQGVAVVAEEAAAARPDAVQAAIEAADEPAVALISSTEMLATSVNAIETADRVVRILMTLNAPRIVLFGDLLSAEECDEMIRLALPKLTRSTVLNANTGERDVHDARTSSGTCFKRGENELIRRIETRISELVRISVENGEGIQILHYLPGTEYKPHYDYFDPKHPGNQKTLAVGGQRIGTLIMYLNDVEAGGATVFPEVGLDVLPRKGNAVLFAYANESGQLDRRTLHGGSPVVTGEKWIATKWIRLYECKQSGT